jgi:hypothetical protein
MISAPGRRTFLLDKGEHGAEWNGDVYALTVAKLAAHFAITLCFENELGPIGRKNVRP